jgi:hypothetical protein
MTKEQFKTKVLNWIKENNVHITGKKVRVYKYRGEWEVRIYGEPMEITNSKRSRRKMELDENGNNCMVGIFSQKIACYTHISESDFESEDEKKFILEILNTN